MVTKALRRWRRLTYKITNTGPKFRWHHPKQEPHTQGCGALVLLRSRKESYKDGWWRWEDLNLRLRAYETPALPLSYTAAKGVYRPTMTDDKGNDLQQ